MKSTKRILALFMAFAMVFCTMPSMAFAETDAMSTATANTQTLAFADIPNDCSTTALSNAVSNGLFKGYE